MNFLRDQEYAIKAPAVAAVLLMGYAALTGCSSELKDNLTAAQRIEIEFTGKGVVDSSQLDGTLNGQTCLFGTIYDPNMNKAEFKSSGDIITVDPYGSGETLVVSGNNNVNDTLQPVDEASEAILRKCNLYKKKD